jgi:hypothetical protein
MRSGWTLIHCLPVTDFQLLILGRNRAYTRINSLLEKKVLEKNYRMSNRGDTTTEFEFDIDRETDYNKMDYIINWGKCF